MGLGTIVVTGADGHQGRAVATALASECDTLVLGGRSGDDLEETATGIDGDLATVRTLRTDARDEYDLERLMETASKAGDGIDAVVAAARTRHDADGPPLSVSYAAVDDELRTNLRGVFATLREAGPHLTADACIVVPIAPDEVADTFGYADEMGIGALVQATAPSIDATLVALDVSGCADEEAVADAVARTVTATPISEPVIPAEEV